MKFRDRDNAYLNLLVWISVSLALLMLAGLALDQYATQMTGFRMARVFSVFFLLSLIKSGSCIVCMFRKHAHTDKPNTARRNHAA